RSRHAIRPRRAPPEPLPRATSAGASRADWHAAIRRTYLPPPQLRAGGLRCQARSGADVQSSATLRAARLEPQHRLPALSQRCPNAAPRLPAPALRCEQTALPAADTRSSSPRIAAMIEDINDD